MRSVRRVVPQRSVDADGSQSVTPAVLLSCLEDVRFSLFARMPAMKEIHRQVARAQRLAFDTRIEATTDMDIEVRLSRVGRTSFDATHIVRAGDEGPVVARAIITMVSLDPEGRPAPVPASLREWVERGPLVAELEAPHPAAAPAFTDDAWSHRFRARPSDENRGSHVSHARFVDYLEDARRLCALDAGFGEGSARGAAPCHVLSVSYEGEAQAGDLLEASACRAADTRDAFDTEIRAAATGVVLARARCWTEG